MNVSVERATPEDAEALLRAQVRAFEHDAVMYPGVEVGGPPGYDSLESMLEKIKNDDTYKIVYEGEIVGGIVVFGKGDGHYHLDLIYLDPEYHGMGIGTQAMVFLDRTYDAVKWTLDTPLYAVRNHHFYEKFGYVKVGEEEEEGTGLILIAYEKSQA